MQDMDVISFAILKIVVLLITLVTEGKAYDDFDKECVRVHNQLRALHNASALCWSESLARDAQKWAESLAYRDRAEHDYQDLITKGQGENIAWMAKAVDKCHGAVKNPGCITCGDIVKKWYSEEKNYDFQKAAAIAVGQPIRHFNQIVWKSTAELGVGSARSDQHGLIVVARYSPMGSTGGPAAFLQNVSPPSYGNSSLDAEGQKPNAGETTIIKITKVVQKLPQAVSPATNGSGETGLPSPPPPSSSPTEAPPTVPERTGSSQTCGVRKPSRIVGGEVAYPGAWPWQTGLKRTPSDIIFCGGSLINKEWVVTASHCVYDMLRVNSDTVLIAVLGEFDKANKEEQEVSIRTKKIIMHPQYDPQSLDYDIALLKLEAPLDFNVYIRPVCLPGSYTKFDERSTCYVTGFGRTQQGGELAGMLRMAKVPLVSKETCEAAYGKEKITDRMICAGFPKGGIDACQGDSGGPLSCLYEGRWYLTGVVSWGVGCAQPNAYGVYAKVQELNEWVDNTMKENE